MSLWAWRADVWVPVMALRPLQLTRTEQPCLVLIMYEGNVTTAAVTPVQPDAVLWAPV